MDALKLSFSNDANSLVSQGQIYVAKTPVILAVDDDEDNLLLMTYILEPLNCSVITETDGQTALEKARTQQPDLILLDIMLFPLDGIQIVSQLKQDPTTRDIPVIAVTALARAEDKERILQAGCNAYISKPYMLEDVVALIHRYLGWTPSVDKFLALDAG
ncbi:MAG: hypothetical protein NVS2B14_16230 [Chamaesiphon sp.]